MTAAVDRLRARGANAFFVHACHETKTHGFWAKLGFEQDVIRFSQYE